MKQGLAPLHPLNENAYVYERLSDSQIRLIRLYADEDHQPLQGEIIRTSIMDAPPFWALSYVWGAAPTSLDADYFNVSNKRLMITPSLHNALKSIRNRGVSILLWADAVCLYFNRY
ncbi:hypothetical protein B0J14DRAFT_494627 [Halenospora varia]|nr:hypothetical protein B0J14DRAFT_494627 [Halenospora varia]